jgi:hypothetical protein
MNANSTGRFTVHRIEARYYYEISAAVLASAGTLSEAKAIAAEFGTPWYHGVAIWDHFGGLVDFGGVEDLDLGYYPLQPVSAVRIRPEATPKPPGSGLFF